MPDREYSLVKLDAHVGVAEVVKEAYPDASAASEACLCSAAFETGMATYQRPG